MYRVGNILVHRNAHNYYLEANVKALMLTNWYSVDDFTRSSSEPSGVIIKNDL